MERIDFYTDYGIYEAKLQLTDLHVFLKKKQNNAHMFPLGLGPGFLCAFCLHFVKCTGSLQNALM